LQEGGKGSKGSTEDGDTVVDHSVQDDEIETLLVEDDFLPPPQRLLKEP